MNKQSALQLVVPVKAPKAKKPSKTEIIAQLENQLAARDEKIGDLNERINDLHQGHANEVSCLKGEIERLENPEQSEVVVAAKQAFRKSSCIAAFMGLIVGGLPPISSFWVAHHEITSNWNDPKNWLMAVLVTCGLFFSAPTVYEWFKTTFRSGWKAFGVTALLEGFMLFSNTPWLIYSLLAVLVSINAIQAACNLSTRKKEPEFKF